MPIFERVGTFVSTVIAPPSSPLLSSLKSAIPTHPAPLANITSHFSSARVQGREGGVRGEREGGVAVVGGRMLSLGNSSSAPAFRSRRAAGCRDGGGVDGMRPAAWERSE